MAKTGVCSIKMVRSTTEATFASGDLHEIDVLEMATGDPSDRPNIQSTACFDGHPDSRQIPKTWIFTIEPPPTGPTDGCKEVLVYGTTAKLRRPFCVNSTPLLMLTSTVRFPAKFLPTPHSSDDEVSHTAGTCVCLPNLQLSPPVSVK